LSLAYGIKTKKTERIITIKRPQITLKNDRSGYGSAKTTPYTMYLDNKIHRRFKTEAVATKYIKSYIRKRKKYVNSNVHF